MEEQKKSKGENDSRDGLSGVEGKQNKSEGENGQNDGLAGGLKNSKGENGQKDGLAGGWKKSCELANGRTEEIRR